ncbi:nitrite reductase [Paenibacillus lactis]|uniref:nitrite reductase n=1 Tax=Paenibacillus lactis TaxID=228574 RepID=UPI0036AC7FA3
MGERVRIAISPSIQIGGNIFTPEQFSKIGSIGGNDAKIEMTPFRQLYMDIPIDQKDRIEEELREIGLEVYPAGSVTKSLIVCNFCKGAETAGLETARVLNEVISGINTPSPLKIGYAGCALGTSEPLLKDIGIVKMRNKFDIYVGGEPKGLKTRIAKLLISGLTEDRLAPVITAIIDYYKANAKAKEKFSRFIDRVTIEQLQKLA